MKKGRKSKEHKPPFVRLLEAGIFNPMVSKVMEMVGGKVHILVTVGDKPAIEIIFKEPDIILDIKNPILAAEAGLGEMIKRRGTITFDSKRLGSFKDMGYKIKIRYRNLEYEL